MVVIRSRGTWQERGNSYDQTAQEGDRSGNDGQHPSSVAINPIFRDKVRLVARPVGFRILATLVKRFL